jgi:hypothetical protein
MRVALPKRPAYNPDMANARLRGLRCWRLD